MKLIASLAAFLFSSPQDPSNKTTVINFDDILTHGGLGHIPSPYSHLTFSSFNVFNPRDPALEGWISENDLNCAVSPPNALIGSRYSSDLSPSSGPASFKIANATSMIEEGLNPYFELLTFYLKPLDMPPPETTIYITGYTYARDEPLVWHVDFPAGYHLPLLVKMQEFSSDTWSFLYAVEIFADFGEDRLDWEFSIDNLELQFFKIPKDKLSPGRFGQRVMKQEEGK
ncbi:hypothetical protein MMC12_007599 [Toensbergia leucococca]|nr:hypothetical protein [Toensbergia leucococca]